MSNKKADLNLRELDNLLEQAFAAASDLYQQRGFQRRIGFGKKPALVSVDLANAWTRPGNHSLVIKRRWMKKLFQQCKSY